MKTNTDFLIITSSFLPIVSNFLNNFVEKNKTRVLKAKDFFFRKFCLYESMRKEYCRAGQAIDVAHAYCMLDT